MLPIVADGTGDCALDSVVEFRSKSSLVLLAMVGAPQPTTSEDHRSSHSKYRKESKAASQWYDEVAHARSLNRDQSSGTKSVRRSLPIFVNVSAVSRTRDICHVRDEWQRNCVGGKYQCGLLLLAAFRLVASGPWFRFDALVLDVRSRIIREHESRAKIHRRRDFFAELQRYL